MLKRIGNVTVATNGANVGIYYQPTPYRSAFAGLDLSRWTVARSITPFVRAVKVGPFVVGRYDLTRP